MFTWLTNGFSKMGGSKKREDFSQLSNEQTAQKAAHLREVLIKKYEFKSEQASLQKLRGLKGLDNLGNTCYMNAALQCLSNTQELTSYLLTTRWVQDINTVNSIGSRGELLCAYAQLLRQLWDGSISDSLNPKVIKRIIGQESEQFEGYEQHDSQEFLSFMIDSLHEDLNKVLKKPYIETKDYKLGQDIGEYARICENDFEKRNQSALNAIFYGMFKSTIRCPDCKHTSITFDPFNMI